MLSHTLHTCCSYRSEQPCFNVLWNSNCSSLCTSQIVPLGGSFSNPTLIWYICLRMLAFKHYAGPPWGYQLQPLRALPVPMCFPVLRQLHWPALGVLTRYVIIYRHSLCTWVTSSHKRRNPLISPSLSPSAPSQKPLLSPSPFHCPPQ